MPLFSLRRLVMLQRKKHQAAGGKRDAPSRRVKKTKNGELRRNGGRNDMMSLAAGQGTRMSEKTRSGAARETRIVAIGEEMRSVTREIIETLEARIGARRTIESARRGAAHLHQSESANAARGASGQSRIQLLHLLRLQ